MKLSIIIPCYNEEKNIPLILEKLGSIITGEDIEVVLVNNGSTDNSQQVLDDLVGQYKFVRIVKVEINQGYGYGILSGLKQARGEFLGWTHADLQTDPYDIVRALEIIERYGSAKNIFVKGNRRGRSILDNFFTFGMSLFETIYLKVDLWDINAQPTLFSRAFYEEWSNPPYDFSLDLYVFYLARIKKSKILRFDVLFPKRIHGASSWDTGMEAKWKFIKRTLEYSTKLKKVLKEQ